MDAKIEQQAALLLEIKQVHSNFKKDGAQRKTEEYIIRRLEKLDELWEKCRQNHESLMVIEDKSHQYFRENIFEVIKGWYEGARTEIASWGQKLPTVPPTRKLGEMAGTDQGDIRFDSRQFQSTRDDDKTAELQQLQNANFRALTRLVKTICIDEIKEKWEIEDKLRCLETRWNAIDKLHLHIDGILNGSDDGYYESFMNHEKQYEQMKRSLNLKINISAYQQHAMPKIDIPTFSGNYTQWPTFVDLYSEAIHNSPALTKAQKMQHLKGRLRGEAEKLVQHLHIASDNYDTCWELLNHRYNNKHLLFTKSFQLFMRQPTLQKQSAFELKRLYDHTSEAIHAIHNLGIDTSSWDPILTYILCEKLDTDTYTEYMQSRTDPREIPTYDHFMDFVENKFIALEPLQRKRAESTPKSQPLQRIQSNNTPYQHNKYQTASSYQPNKTLSTPYYKSRNFHAFNVGQFNKIYCPLCKDDHALYHCTQFINMTDADKLRFVAKGNICKNCLFVHTKGYCASQKKCRECNDTHNSLLHNAVLASAQAGLATTKPMTKITPPPIKSVPTTSNKVAQNNFASNDDDEILLATVLVKVKNSEGDFITLRGFLDQGSQITLLTENAAQKLGLPRKQMNASISGIGTISNKSKGKVNLICQSLHNDFQFTTEALVMTRVVNNLPNVTLTKKYWPHVSNITLADPEYNTSRPVDILFDAHVYSEILMNGLLKGEEHQPMAQQTQLGWILSGSVKTYNCHVVVNNIEDLTKYWEIEDVGEGTTCSKMTPEEQRCEEFFVQTTKRLTNGKYEVRLPMKDNFEQQLGSSKPQAIAQFMQLERRLQKDEQLSANYIKFMQEYLEMGHMKESKGDTSPFCYLPHHGVLKQDSVTTKLRVVFNASQKTGTGRSLNDLMDCGPKLHQDLLTLLLGWRLYRYVFTADCEKMYRMILLNKEDQQLQKILWRQSNEAPLKEYQLCTVTYGTKAAPFLALRTLKQLAEDDARKYPLAADVITNQMYVDDVLSGSQTITKAHEIQQQLIQMLRGAGLTLRKWNSNEPSLLETLSDSELNQTTTHFKSEGLTKTLGLHWNPQTDNFIFTNKINKCIDSLTKRTLLSEISKTFDPVGFLTPLTIRSKLLFQKIWLSNCTWDDVLPKELQDEWKAFLSDIDDIQNFTMPRWLGDMTKPFQIHGFCDASEKVYACVIYVRTVNDMNEPLIRLIVAKSRLAPINNKLTLPRLELCAAVLLAQLMKKVLQAFKWEHIDKNTYAWSDSMIVLSWLNGDVTRWKTFVSNRVQKVCDVIPKEHWNYVKSEDNAADCATRGVSCSQLLKHPLWFQGPEWLKTFDKNAITSRDVIQTNLELKTKQQSYVTQSEPSSVVVELIDAHSDMTHITRVLTWIQRFINNLKSSTKIKTNYLTSTEIKNAEKTIVKCIQLHTFQEEIWKLMAGTPISLKSSLLTLTPYLDGENILRVGGRLKHSKLSDDTKNPMLLPHNHKLTDLLVWQAHHQTLHGGPKLTLTRLRQKYWTVGGLRAVKRVLHKCTICRRYQAKVQNQIMADLPQPRVTVSRPFTHTGVDFTGHIEIKASKGRGVKTLLAYIAVFVCLATKAAHLELVTELSSSAFLAAFKRFCARRGTPSDMYSDNGTNFTATNRILRQQYNIMLQTIDTMFLDKIGEMGINWHFNAPGWPTAGGLWEACVKSVKHHLKRVIGDQRLTYEEMTTLLCHIEACLNSRPLCTVTESIEDIDCLTPGHFLTGTSNLTIPQADAVICDLRTRWQMLQKITKDFWKKWSQEYLQQLQARVKWQRTNTDPKLNDIVCIKNENVPAGKWALGRIIELHPGKDGYTRVVTLKTARGETKRPITKLVPLVDEDRNVTKNKNDNDKTKRRNKTDKFNLKCFSSLLLLFTLFTPSLPQATNNIHITPLTRNQTIYFDKVADLHEVKDEWKVVFYYNMTNYWQNVDALQQFVTHVKTFQKDGWAMQFHVLVNQLEQNTQEISYYNDLLKTHNLIQKRYRRGLIDGIGYVANSLFGVLDQRFAEKYEIDIKTLQHNDNHLLQLIKNQTSILEAEHNILQRNEATMAKHFNLINEHLISLQNDTLQQQKDTQNAFYIITSAIAAEAMVQNLKYIQQTLINTLTNMYRGHIDIHLISPNQLQTELNKIARQLPHNLALPDIQDNVREIYRLFRIHANIVNNFLMMEIKIPLLGDEPYELYKLISIPQRVDSNRIINVIPTSEMIAFNADKFTFVPLDQSDIYSCQKIQEEKLMCKLNQPVYSTRNRGESICDVQLIHNNEKHDAYCHSVTTTCTDKWVKLHKQNTWLYYCCDVCVVHTMCPAGMTSDTLRSTGLLTLGRGCVLRGDTFMLHATLDYTDNVMLYDPIHLNIPTISPVNYILKTSLTNTSLQIETHEDKLQNIKDQLDTIKEESKLETFSVHDWHHYTMIYVVLTISIALFVVSLLCWRRIIGRRNIANQSEETRGSELGRMEHLHDADRQQGVTASPYYSEIKCKPEVHISVDRVKSGVPSSSKVKFDTDRHSDSCVK